MKNFLAIIFLLVLLNPGLIAQTALSVQEREEIKETVLLRSLEFEKLFASDKSVDRLERFVNLFVDSEDPAWMGTPALISSERINCYTKEEVKDLHQRVFSIRVETPINIKERYFAVLSREVVYELVTQEYYFVANNGYRSPDTEATFTRIWVLRNNQWKILHMTRSLEEKN